MGLRIGEDYLCQDWITDDNSASPNPIEPRAW